MKDKKQDSKNSPVKLSKQYKKTEGNSQKLKKYLLEKQKNSG
jgi:hypothetical protein